MAGADPFLTGPAGSLAALAAMTLAAYLCRIAGAALMTHVRFTPWLERALAALPGSLVAATVVPIALRSDVAATVGILTGLAVRMLAGNDFAALIAGLGAAALTRFAGA